MLNIDKRYPAFHDDDLMSFGKYKNQRLSDVPASYLYWLWHNTGINATNPKLANYIWNVQEDIKQEMGEEFIRL